MKNFLQFSRYLLSLITIFACAFMFFSLLGYLVLKVTPYSQSLEANFIKFIVVFILAFFQTFYFHKFIYSFKQKKGKIVANKKAEWTVLAIFTVFCGLFFIFMLRFF
jgi:hypothetical protein